MKYYYLLVLTVLVQLQSFGQETAKLKIEPAFYEVQAGETISFSVYHYYSNGRVELRNAPKGAFLDDSLNFSWSIPKKFDEENISFDFLLYDSTALLDIKTVFIKIKTKHLPPVITINSNQQKRKGIYYIQPSETLELTFTGLSQSSSDSNRVKMSYMFNNYEKTAIDEANIHIEKNKLFFSWSPDSSNRKEKYITLTVIADESNQASTQKTVLLVVNFENKEPYFTYPVLDEYYISAGETLDIDLSATDPNHDSLTYRLIIPSTLGNPTLSKKGKFQWKLNEDQIMRLRNQFPMTVKVEVTEMGTDAPFTIERTFQIKKNIRNQPPKILNLQNENIQEGLVYEKTIFIEDANDDYSDLTIDIRGAPRGMKWEFVSNMLKVKWTPGFDVIGVDLQPRKFDMLLVVEDPYGYVDQKAFTLTVMHRENTELTFDKYLEFRDKATFMIEVLAQMHAEMEQREEKVHNIKKGLSVLTMFFAAYTAGGAVYEPGSFAKELVPFIGVFAAIAGGINAFGFNDLGKYGTLRQGSFVLQQKMMSILAILNEYNIESKNSPNLENVEFRENLNTFQKWMVQDKLDFKNYYNNFKTLDYVKKMTRRERREAASLGVKPKGILFIDLVSF